MESKGERGADKGRCIRGHTERADMSHKFLPQGKEPQTPTSKTLGGPLFNSIQPPTAGGPLT